MRLLTSGSWWVKSNKDPRWNKSGYTDFAGGFVQPSECEHHMEEMKKLYGEPPDDCEWGYMKD